MEYQSCGEWEELVEDGPDARMSAPSINFQTDGTNEMRRRRDENVTKQQVKKGALFALCVACCRSRPLVHPQISADIRISEIIMQSHLLPQLFASHLPSSGLHKHPPLSTRDGRGSLLVEQKAVRMTKEYGVV